MSKIIGDVGKLKEKVSVVMKKEYVTGFLISLLVVFAEYFPDYFNIIVGLVIFSIVIHRAVALVKYKIDYDRKLYEKKIDYNYDTNKLKHDVILIQEQIRSNYVNEKLKLLEMRGKVHSKTAVKALENHMDIEEIQNHFKELDIVSKDIDDVFLNDISVRYEDIALDNVGDKNKVPTTSELVEKRFEDIKVDIEVKENE